MSTLRNIGQRAVVLPQSPGEFDAIREQEFRLAVEQELKDIYAFAATIELDAGAIISGTFDDALIAESNVTQHQAALALAASQITSGTFADARIAESNVTQHQAALALAGSQITSGTVADARLSTNVSLLDTVQAHTAELQIVLPSLSDHIRLERTGSAADDMDIQFASSGLFFTWSGVSTTARWNFDGANDKLSMPSPMILQWANTDAVQGTTFDVNLYRGGANRLETDDQFAADSLRVTGTDTQLFLDETGDSVTANPETDSETGWLKVDVNGATRYIPFYTA